MRRDIALACHGRKSTAVDIAASTAVDHDLGRASQSRVSDKPERGDGGRIDARDFWLRTGERGGFIR